MIIMGTFLLKNVCLFVGKLVLIDVDLLFQRRLWKCFCIDVFCDYLRQLLI